MQIIDRLFMFFRENNLSNYKVEQTCGLSNGYLRNLRKAPSVEILEKIFSAYPELNREWVMSGTGDMLRSSAVDPSSVPPSDDRAMTERRPREEAPIMKPVAYGGIPLVPIDAVAGFNGWDESGISELDCARYDVPDFAAVHADFLIRVSGSSMYPKYSSGDILACRKIVEVTFIQWGKIYVIDSQQGAMVKRLFPIEGDDEHVLCKSDNPNYLPFELPKDEIRSLSIVVGAIRLE